MTDLSLREVFNKLVDLMAAHSESQKQTAEAITTMSKTIEHHERIIKSKLWWIVYTALAIAAGSIGIKLIFP